MIPKPLNDNVIILPDPIEESKSGGLIVPDELKERPLKGTVIAASNGYYARETGTFIPIEVTENDRILFQRFRGTEIIIDEVKHFVLKQDEILAKI